MASHSERVKAATLLRLERDLDQHVLKVLADTGPVLVVRLHRPGTRIMSVQLTFTPEGIAIQGDFHPHPTDGNQGGLCCRDRKPPGWFAADLGWDYLASKFMSRQWCREAQADDLRGRIADLRHEAQDLDATEAQAVRDKADALQRVLDEEDSWSSVYEYQDALDAIADERDDEPALVYPEPAAADLWAIQRKFRELALASGLIGG